MILARRWTYDDPRRRLAWLLSLLALTVILPSAGLLWLFSRAGEQERELLEQRFRALGQRELTGAVDRWEARWREAEAHWREAGSFAELVGEPLFASAALLDPESDIVSFPQRDSDVPQPALLLTHPLWSQARSAEFAGLRCREAELLYQAIERTSSSPSERLHAWQARLRCLVKEGQSDEALRQWEGAVEQDDSSHAVWETALCLFIESAPAKGLGERLRTWLEGNGSRTLPLSKRLFMMETLREGGFPCATEAAERLFASFSRRIQPSLQTLILIPLGDDLWQVTAPDRRSLVVLRSSAIEEIFAGADRPSGHAVHLHDPSEKADGYLNQTLSGPLSGWTLSLHLSDGTPALAEVKGEISRWTRWITVLAIALALAAALVLCRLILRESRLNRLRNDFLATVSHELKTPVAATRLLIDNLFRKATQDPLETREYLGLISKENERLCRLIEHFLSFSRMEQGRHAFLREPVQISDIAREAADVMRERLGGHRRIQETHASGLPLVSGDREALTTVVVNLLDNAVKYSREDVSVTTSLHARQLRISVEDRGIGLTSEAQRKVFQKFYREDASLTNETPGVGIGLSIVDFIVREHEGWVDIDSVPGRGSRFTVNLPTHPSSHAGFH